jgi:hypothetical protein
MVIGSTSVILVITLIDFELGVIRAKGLVSISIKV